MGLKIRLTVGGIAPHHQDIIHSQIQIAVQDALDIIRTQAVTGEDRP